MIHIYIYIYPNLPIPTLLWVLIINPSIDFIGTLQKSRFWRVKVYIYICHKGIPILQILLLTASCSDSYTMIL